MADAAATEIERFIGVLENVERQVAHEACVALGELVDSS